MGQTNGEINESLVQEYRHINVEHYEWWDSAYEDFAAEMREQYINVGEINFTGFYSQGDGASFVGHIEASDFAKFMDLHGLSERYPACKYFADQKELYLEVYRNSSRYCHEYSVDVAVRDITGNPYDEGTTRWDIYDTMQTLFDSEFADLELDCEEIMRDHMRDLYRKLEKEHDYLTSDEQVWETIVANDLHLQETN